MSVWKHLHTSKSFPYNTNIIEYETNSDDSGLLKARQISPLIPISRANLLVTDRTIQLGKIESLTRVSHAIDCTGFCEKHSCIVAKTSPLAGEQPVRDVLVRIPLRVNQFSKFFELKSFLIQIKYYKLILFRFPGW